MDTGISEIATNFLGNVINMMMLAAEFGGGTDSDNRIGDPIAKPRKSIAGDTSCRTRRPEGIDLRTLRCSEKE